MTTIKTWEERYRDNFKGDEDARRQIAIAQHAEIKELRAAVERKDVLLRECLTVIWFDADSSKVRVKITKELS